MKTIFDFRAFFNFLRRNKLYTTINIVGFSVSLMFVILLATYIRHELAADTFHTNRERIFRLYRDNYCAFPPRIGPELKNRYPEIEDFVRMCGSQAVLSYQNNKLFGNVLFTDPQFFRTFSFGLQEGDVSQALQTKNEALISETFARRLFGSGENILGRQIKFNNNQTFTINGVIRPFGNSHIEMPDIMLSFESLVPAMWQDPDFFTSDSYSMFPLYLLVKPHTDLSSKLPDMVAHFKNSFRNFQTGGSKTLTLEPLEEVYFSEKEAWLPARAGNKKLVATLVGVSLLILLFAIINYINLSVAQTESRAREMATRRLLGCSRSALFIRLITESIILCSIALLIALILAHAAEPLFNRMLSTDISVTGSLSVLNILSAVGFTILLGCFSGIVPATIITGAKPIEVVRGTFRRKTKMGYNKILIGFQYFITIVLIGCTITMSRQIHHMLHADLGFDSAGKLLITNTGLSPAQVAGFKNKLLQIAGVEDVAAAMDCPFIGQNNRSGTYHDQPISFQEFRGDSSFFKIMGFEILRDNHNRDTRAIWLNQTAMREMELSDTVSYCEFYKRPIAGIVRDFQYWDLTRRIEPAVIMRPGQRQWPQLFIVQMASADPFRTYREIEKTYREYSGGEPFDAKYSETVIRQVYQTHQRTSELLGWFTLVAIVISALGIFAMATYFTRQRLTEIAVRKVFGSTNREILERLTFNFVRYILIAFIIAVPVIWYLMHDWLAQFIDQIPLNWLIFTLSGLIALIIALVTVFGQNWKAANTNPVDSIKR